jgi:phosphoribosylformylglycinamidine synthase subunit PurQ / glutaminase
MPKGQELTIPIAHHDGNYTAEPETVARLQGEGRVAFRYADNPNGSVDDIAGILSQNRRVLGMMPHPERAVAPIHGSTDGQRMFESLISAFAPA